MKLYMTPASGNAYKVRLLLAMMQLPYEKVMVDFEADGHKRPEFLKLNPRGQVPALYDDGRVFWDSTACLVYVAAKYGEDRWFPTDPSGMGEVMQWLALSNNEIHYGLQWARAVVRGHKAGNLEEYRAYGRQGLEVLEERLLANEWLALGRPTIADIACYPYVAVAPQGVLSLDPYRAVCDWIARFEALPGWIPRL